MTRLRIRKALDKPELIRGSNPAIAAACDSTLIEVRDARANTAESMLRLESMDEVLA